VYSSQQLVAAAERIHSSRASYRAVRVDGRACSFGWRPLRMGRRACLLAARPLVTTRAAHTRRKMTLVSVVLPRLLLMLPLYLLVG
jgi:hypothetical protein